MIVQKIVIIGMISASGVSKHANPSSRKITERTPLKGRLPGVHILYRTHIRGALKFTCNGADVCTNDIGDDVKDVVTNGQKIGSYPDDRPHPSYLMLSYISQRAIHVIIAVDSKAKRCIIITAYEPSSDLWDDDFKTRK